MAHRFLGEHRRYADQSERSFAESILGADYSVRVYARHGNVLRGTSTINNKGIASVHNAYVIYSGAESKSAVSGTAVGVLIDKSSGSVSVVLSDKDSYLYQHEIAEAVDYWEHGNSNKIYCLREKSCGAVVFTEADGTRKYLIIRMNLGHCGLPKGHIEKYETEIDTALREVREETGVEIELVDGFRKSVEYSLSARTKKESVYFLGRFDGGDVKIQEAEVSSYRLCSYETARRLITYENDRLILDAAEALLSGKTE